MPSAGAMFENPSGDEMRRLLWREDDRGGRALAQSGAPEPPHRAAAAAMGLPRGPGEAGGGEVLGEKAYAPPVAGAGRTTS